MRRLSRVRADKAVEESKGRVRRYRGQGRGRERKEGGCKRLVRFDNAKVIGQRQLIEAYAFEYHGEEFLAILMPLADIPPGLDAKG